MQPNHGGLARKLGVSCAQFDACDRAACALARPAIDADKKVLFLTQFELDELFKCFMNGYGDGDYVESYCQTAAPETAFSRVQKKLLQLWAKKKLAAGKFSGENKTNASFNQRFIYKS